ncbi:phage pi2 protein 07 [Thalassobacillus devorans]|uniref:group-specific protein n=1 Tax=Thalassobacillus devorans TaxID=279813 RepID=UPI001E198A49|nr:group-specific protein [Thalassobacillus devorans]NIK28056.1 phage pi2 protein 07 [Thalassobacillus devorans]
MAIILHFRVNEEEVNEVIKKQVEETLSKLNTDLVVWDSKELKRRVSMSWSTIQSTFFYEEDFPKVKIGGKWYYPAKETEEFLSRWFKHQMGA